MLHGVNLDLFVRNANYAVLLGAYGGNDPALGLQHFGSSHGMRRVNLSERISPGDQKPESTDLLQERRLVLELNVGVVLGCR